MKPRFPSLKKIISLLLICSIPLLSACGNDGEPFEMDMSSTMVVGDPEPAASTSAKAILNPSQQEVDGIMEAVITNELSDRFEIEVLAVNMTATFPDVGEIRLVLNPNFESSGTIFKLNRNNNLFGMHNFNLNLIIETPDQNLTLDDLTLENNTAVLPVVGDLPLLNFFVNDQPKQLDILQLELTIPSNLVITTDDPQ